MQGMSDHSLSTGEPLFLKGNMPSKPEGMFSLKVERKREDNQPLFQRHVNFHGNHQIFITYHGLKL